MPHRVDGVPAVTVAWRARGIPVPKMDYVRIYALSEEDRLFELGELFDVGPPPACNTSTGFWESFDNELLLPEFRPGRTVLVVDLVLDPEGGAYEDVLYVDLLEPD